MRFASRGGRARSDGERSLDGGGVAAGADGLHAVDLLALERRVDAQDLELAVVALGEVVDADDDALARSYLAAGA